MKLRIISAIVFISILIPLLIIGGTLFALAIGLLGLLAYKELIDLKEKEKEIPMIVKILGIISLMGIIYMTLDGYSLLFGISYQALSLSMILLLLPVVFLGDRYTTKDAFYLIGFVVFLGIFFNALILIVDMNVWILVFLILITAITDTFAMVTGKLIGKNKLIPSVSPNKTWEGSILGTLCATGVATIFYLNMIDGDINKLRIVTIVLLLSIIGQIGDLIFSKIKRENKIKDFSNIMPGHGGILDRIDSIMFVVLAFIIISSYL